ncbi:hypothetical protein BD770DRAFT_383353 [Pilaira anomala]|nr:hypothetical protein BD770DRAFT_383353 [Pilaira anomala]
MQRSCEVIFSDILMFYFSSTTSCSVDPVKPRLLFGDMYAMFVPLICLLRLVVIKPLETL